MSARTRWRGSRIPRFDADGIRIELGRLDTTCHLIHHGGRVGAVAGGETAAHGDHQVLAEMLPLPPERLGSFEFRRSHGVRLAYVAGSMANGIASADLVIALARAGILASFGAAGLSVDRISDALDRFAHEIPELPFAANLIHSPAEPRAERSTVDLYLRRGVRCVEASAFMDLTGDLVRYSVSGLRRDRLGNIVADNRVLAKVSRPEVAEKFMRPAPAAIVDALVASGQIHPDQAELAKYVPIATDITGEADSGGHTDRRPSSVITSTLLRLREQVLHEHHYQSGLRIGAAGGMGTPEALAAAFAMGVDYVMTGSVNQSCVEAGTSAATKRLLASAGMADFALAPAADMFEIGADVQVLKKGTMFPMRAAKLRELYRQYDGLDALPETERRWLESVLRESVENVWAQCVDFFSQRDPEQIDRAEADPKRKMALLFRWYLGMSSNWANQGRPDRVQDYQIWCGPAMGGFNSWAAGSHLELPENRFAADVAQQLMTGAAYHLRIMQLRAAGAAMTSQITSYPPACGIENRTGTAMPVNENI